MPFSPIYDALSGTLLRPLLLLIPKPLALPVDLLPDDKQSPNRLKPLIHDDDLTPKEDKDKREEEKVDDPKKFQEFFHVGSLISIRALRDRVRV